MAICTWQLDWSINWLMDDSLHRTVQPPRTTPCLQKTVHFCFCQNIVKFPWILISFGMDRWKNSWNYILCIRFPPDPCHHTTLLKADVLNFYLTLDLLQSDCSDLVSKWRQHTVATTFLLTGHCQTYAGCPETIFYVSTGRQPGASALDTVAFQERERCEKRVVV